MDGALQIEDRLRRRPTLAGAGSRVCPVPPERIRNQTAPPVPCAGASCREIISPSCGGESLRISGNIVGGMCETPSGPWRIPA